MAERLITIKVNTEAQAKQLTQVELRLRDLQKTRARLQKKQQDGIGLTGQERRSLERVNKEIIGLSGEKRKYTQVVKNNINAIKSAKGSYQQLVSETAQLRNRLKEMPGAFDKNNKAANRLKNQIFSNTKRLKEFDASMNQHQRNVGNYTGGIKGAAAQLGKFAIGLTAGIASVHAIIQVFKNAADIVKNFEQAQANLASILGVSRSEITALTEDAKRLGATTAFTASEVSGLQTEFAKLGFSTQEILNATEATLALAAATNTDLAEAATVAGATLRGFGLNADETQRVVDVMAKAFSSSALDMSKFSTAMAQVAPVAKNTGLSIEETTAMLGLLTDRGVDASTAGTGLRGILLDLSKTGKTLDQALAEINSSTNKNATAFDMFGKRGATVAAILAENQDQAAELTEKLNNAGGAAQRMADEQLDTLGGKLKILNSAWEGLILQIEDGEGAMGGFAASVIEALTDLITNTQEFTAEFQRIKEESMVVKGAINILTTVIKTSFKIMFEAAKAVFRPLQEIVNIIDLAINKKFTEIPGAIKSAFTGAVDDIVGTATDIANDWVDAYRDTVTERIDENATLPFVKEQWSPFLENSKAVLTEGMAEAAEAAAKEAGKTAEKAAIEAAKRQSEVDAILLRMEQARIATLEDAREREIQALELKHEQEKEKLKGNHQAIQLLEQEHRLKLAEINATHDQIAEEKKIAQLEADALARAEKDVLTAETRMAELEALRQFEQQKFDIAVQNTQLTDDQVALIHAQHAKKIADIEAQITEVKTDEAAERAAVLQKQFDEMSAFTMQSGQLLGEFMADQEQDFGKFIKQMLLMLVSHVEKVVLASIAEATAKSLAQTDSVTTFGATGVARAAIMAGLIKAAFTAFKAGIQNTEFQRGGVLQGASHAQGGIPFTVGGRPGFEAEGGEAIINKKSTALFTPLLSAINQAGGGVPFERGGVTKFQAGAIPNMRTLMRTADAPTIQMEEFAANIIRGINDKRVINVATETTREDQRVRNIQTRASFG